MIFKECPYCHKTYHAGHRKRRFCSRICLHKWLSENQTKEKNPNFGHKWGVSLKKRVSETRKKWFLTHQNPMKGLTKENSEIMRDLSKKVSATIKKMRQDHTSVYNSTKYRKNLSKSLIGRNITWNEKMSESAKKLWSNMSEDVKERRLIKWRNSTLVKPSGLEIEYIKFFKEYNLPFKYTGDGSFWMGQKPSVNPDFCCTIKNKIFIEVGAKRFREYTHGSWDIWVKERKNKYDSYSSKVLFLCEEDLDNPLYTTEMVTSFVENS